MKMMRKLLGITFLLAILVGCLVFHASALSNETELDPLSNYCGGEGDGTNLEWTLDSDGTLTISGSGAMKNFDYSQAPWYSERSSIKEVVIGDSVTSIGSSAFQGCTNLTSVTIPDSVTTIGDGAFQDCTGLTSVTIGDSVTTIGDLAFYECINLAAIDVDENNTYFTDIDGVLFNKNKTTLIWYPGGRSDASYVIPDSVTTIGDDAFYGCTGLTSVTIPDSVTTIGRRAFYGCTGLTSVTIPDSVTTIGDDAFYGCTGLTSVTIPDSVTTIDDSAFANCYGLTSVTIGNSVTSIGEYAFRYCTGLTSVTIRNSVTTIGRYAFYGCTGLTSVTIPDSVQTIGSHAFDGCTSLTSVYFEGNAPVVEDSSAFLSYATTLFHIPGTTGWTDSDAYNAAAGTWHTYRLAIWEDRGGYCGGARGGTNLYWLIDNDGTLTISGSGAMKDYGNGTAPWYAVRNSIKEVIIGDDVTTIGSNAFSDCDGMTSVTIGSSVTTIGNNAFYWCSSLTSVTIPDSVTDIGRHSFSYCLDLTSLTMGNSVTTIGWYAFAYCLSLTSVDFPASVTSIGWYAFDYCNKLTSVYFEGNAPAVGDYVFQADKVTLYYISGTTGWTDSKAYNPYTGTWNGYRMELPAEERSKLKYVIVEEDDVRRIQLHTELDPYGNLAQWKDVYDYKAVVAPYGEDGTITAEDAAIDDAVYYYMTNLVKRYDLASNKKAPAALVAMTENKKGEPVLALRENGVAGRAGNMSLKDYEDNYMVAEFAQEGTVLNNKSYVLREPNTDGTGGVYATSETVFMIRTQTGDKDDPYAYEQITGYKNLLGTYITESMYKAGEAQNYTNIQYFVDKDHTDFASYVFIDAIYTKVAANFILLDRSNYGIQNVPEELYGKDYQVYNAIVNGEKSILLAKPGKIADYVDVANDSVEAGVLKPGYLYEDNLSYLGVDVDLKGNSFGVYFYENEAADAKFNAPVQYRYVVAGDEQYIRIGTRIYLQAADAQIWTLTVDGGAPTAVNYWFNIDDQYEVCLTPVPDKIYNGFVIMNEDTDEIVGLYHISDGTNEYWFPTGGESEETEPPVEINAEFTHTGNSLELEGIVYINNYSQIKGFSSNEYVAENGGLLIWKNAVTEEEATFENAEDVNPGLVYDAKNDEFLSMTDGIPTKEFADELYLRIYVLGEDGNYYYGELKPYSVKEYCEGRIAKSTSAKMKALAAQMLHYGAAAQTYFDYNLDSLANADITNVPTTFDAALIDALVPYTSAPTYTVDANVKDNGKALTLVGAILVDFYFKAPTTYTDGVLQVWDDTADLTEENFYEVPMEYDSKAKEWHGQTDGIFAKYYGKTIYARAKFTNADGAACYGPIVSYSVEEYCIGRINKSTNAEMVELAKRLVIYGDCAKAYFNA